MCCQVEVSATSWSLVQRSPTDCGVSQQCVIVKPRRNEEAQAQANIGLSSHRKKILKDKYVAFIKRWKERKYKERRAERKRDFNQTLLEVMSNICST
jgi:hypothetical protein